MYSEYLSLNMSALKPAAFTLNVLILLCFYKEVNILATLVVAVVCLVTAAHLVKGVASKRVAVLACRHRMLPHIIKPHVRGMKVDFPTLIPQLASRALAYLLNSALQIVRIECFVNHRPRPPLLRYQCTETKSPRARRFHPCNYSPILLPPTRSLTQGLHSH